VAGLLVRLDAVTGGVGAVVDGTPDPAAALTALGRTGLVAASEQTPAEVRYVASPAARERLGEERDGDWPASVSSRQRKSMRRAPGAVFTFPMENTGEDGVPDAIEVFITDWSPSPAACAVAVHTAHPANPGVELRGGSAFTGRHCRHPLTGDLLPVWVAHWVKPEFGTGAVLVNPGHDRVDLAFGRAVGLPIRFGLAPEDYDGTPANWLTPPVIKTGVALRTGATDGLPYAEARAAYLRTLLDHGLARTCTDFGFAAVAVARAEPDGPTVLAWDGRRGMPAVPGHESTEDLRVMANPVLAATDPQVRSAELAVVAPSTSTETDLLALRLLLAEPGFEPQVEKAPAVHLVGAVAGQADGVEPTVLRLALLSAAGIGETLSLKPQQLESPQRFLEMHTKVAGLTPETAGAVSAEVAKAAVQIRDLLVRHDTKQAFTQLYRLQKTVVKGAGVTAGDVRVYETLAYVLAGVEVSLSPDDLAATWQSI
jgi:hypothetical protein